MELKYPTESERRSLVANRDNARSMFRSMSEADRATGIALVCEAYNSHGTLDAAVVAFADLFGRLPSPNELLQIAGVSDA